MKKLEKSQTNRNYFKKSEVIYESSLECQMRKIISDMETMNDHLERINKKVEEKLS